MTTNIRFEKQIYSTDCRTMSCLRPLSDIHISSIIVLVIKYWSSVFLLGVYYLEIVQMNSWIIHGKSFLVSIFHSKLINKKKTWCLSKCSPTGACKFCPKPSIFWILAIFLLPFIVISLWNQIFKILLHLNEESSMKF